jgi:IPT/TIG domain
MRWYGYLAAMRCDDALTEVEGSGYETATYAAYAGAGHACIAIQNSDQKAWERAAEYLDLAGEEGLKPCLDEAVLQVLKNLVAAHKADPDRRIELAKPDSSIQACDFSIGKIDPESGPLHGPNTVVISGTGLADWAVKAVLFGRQRSETVFKGPDADNSISVEVPSAQEPGPVQVVLVMHTGERYDVPGEYTYVDDSGATAAPVVPEEEPVVPEEGLGVPEEEPPVIPEEAPVVPEEELVVPEEEPPVIPEEAPVVPEDEPVNPEEGPPNPEQETELNEAQVEGDGLTLEGGS